MHGLGDAISAGSSTGPSPGVLAPHCAAATGAPARGGGGDPLIGRARRSTRPLRLMSSASPLGNERGRRRRKQCPGRIARGLSVWLYGRVPLGHLVTPPSQPPTPPQPLAQPIRIHPQSTVGDSGPTWSLIGTTAPPASRLPSAPLVGPWRPRRGVGLWCALLPLSRGRSLAPVGPHAASRTMRRQPAARASLDRSRHTPARSRSGPNPRRPYMVSRCGESAFRVLNPPVARRGAFPRPTA